MKAQFILVLFALFSVYSIGCSFLPSKGEPPLQLRDQDITIVLSENEQTAFSSVQEFFQANKLLVSRVQRKNGNQYWLDYPSINDGPSPMFSHKVDIQVRRGFPMTLDQLIHKNHLGVFRSNKQTSSLELVGYVTSTKTSGAFDWFSERKELLHQR